MGEQLVSILIPCYNAERWIALTLESALSQTWPKKEIIVVNNGSTDGSLEILKKFESEQVKIITKENHGASAARNRAYHESQGDVIQFLDADDLMSPDKIELQMKRLADAPNCVAAGAWGRFYDDPKNTVFVHEPLWADFAPVDWLVTAWTGSWMMASHAWLTPRSLIERAGDWDETPCPNDDGEFFTRVVLSSEGVLFCPESRVYYRSGRPGATSQSKSTEMLHSMYRSIELCTSYLLSKEDSPRTRKACASYFQNFVYQVYPHVPNLVQQAEAQVRNLGGCDLNPPVAGAIHSFLVSTLNWKYARRIQLLKQRFI